MVHNRSFEVFVFSFGEGSVFDFLPLGGEGVDLLLVHVNFLGLEGEGFDEVEVGVSDEGPEDPQEGLFVLVVRLGGDVEILEVSLAVEGNLAGLHFALLLVHLVAHQHDGDVVADSGQVLVPLGHVPVSDAGGHVEHQDRGVGANVVSLAQASQLLLAGGVPDSELDGAVVGVEGDGADLNALSGDVLLLELPGDVSLDEGGLSDSTVSDEHDFELGDNLRSLNKWQMYVHCC